MVHKKFRNLGLRVKPKVEAALPPPVPPAPPPEPLKGWENFLVAQKRAMGPWPAGAQKRIEVARAAYDAGTHEMVTRTKDGWCQLYCRPRVNVAPRRTYFTKQEAA